MSCSTNVTETETLVRPLGAACGQGQQSNVASIAQHRLRRSAPVGRHAVVEQNVQDRGIAELVQIHGSLLAGV
jgi:hypothetical protein